MKKIILLLIFLFLPISLVNATPKMSIYPSTECYQQQSVDYSNFVDYKSYEYYNFNKTFFAFSYCQYFRKNQSFADCIREKLDKIIILQPGETECDYALDKETCKLCIKQKLEEQQLNIGKYYPLSHILITLTLLLLSFFFVLYTLLIGITSLIKKRIVGPKWLFYVALGITIIIIILFLFFYKPQIYSKNLVLL